MAPTSVYKGGAYLWNPLGDHKNDDAKKLGGIFSELIMLY